MMTIQLPSAQLLSTARSQSHWVYASSLGNLCLGDPSVAHAADAFKSILTLKSPESLHHPCPCISVAPTVFVTIPIDNRSSFTGRFRSTGFIQNVFEPNCCYHDDLCSHSG